MLGQQRSISFSVDEHFFPMRLSSDLDDGCLREQDGVVSLVLEAEEIPG